MTQSGRHDAISISCVNPKIKRLPVKRRHIVLIYSSLLSVRNCDTSRFGDRSPAGHCASENRLTLRNNSSLPAANSRLTVIQSVFC
jgi:hypothetical protein